MSSDPDTNKVKLWSFVGFLVACLALGFLIAWAKGVL